MSLVVANSTSQVVGWLPSARQIDGGNILNLRKSLRVLQHPNLKDILNLVRQFVPVSNSAPESDSLAQQLLGVFQL